MMKKARFILLICTLTAAAWSLPGVAFAKCGPKAPKSLSGVSAFDGHSMFDGGSAFDGH
jgi:hypothetical protein